MGRPASKRGRMPANDRIAARLMLEFATRTGLFRKLKVRVDIFGPMHSQSATFLSFSRAQVNQKYREYAIRLIDQVHQVLGRYRDDDVRHGWISGLDEETGRRHPTIAGLRIGKPLKERQNAEPFDERLEWDRDGQYFHYLTKWMHALCQTAIIANKSEYARWAGELASAAFQGFGCASKSTGGGLIGIYWKMSTDLSRPLVSAMGLHDVVDGLITFREVEKAMATISVASGMSNIGVTDRVPMPFMSGQGLDDGRSARTGWTTFRRLPPLPVV